MIDHWWQTETGWAIAANCLGIERLPVVPGSPTRAVPGWDLRVLDDDGAELPAGRDGRARGQAADAARRVARRSGTPTSASARPTSPPFPGYYQTADAGYIDESGYVFVMARTDDIINVAGHRLSTGAIEEVLAAHPDVAECAVIGVADELKGQLPLGLRSSSRRASSGRTTRSSREAVQLVRERIGPVASFKTASSSSGCRRPAPGKILRGTMRRIADDRGVRDPGDDRRPRDPRRDHDRTSTAPATGPPSLGRPPEPHYHPVRWPTTSVSPSGSASSSRVRRV